MTAPLQGGTALSGTVSFNLASHGCVSGVELQPEA